MPLLDPTRRQLDNGLLFSPWSTCTRSLSELPAISTTTLNERTTVRVFALWRNDYAGQDPINGYDLAGTFCFTCEAGAVWREFKATASTALPIVAGAAVLTVCPECFVVAGIAAGATSFVARMGFDHSSPKQAAIGAAIDAIATLGQARLEKVLFKQLDRLLVTYAMRNVPDIRIYYMFKEINYDRSVAFHHR